MSGRYDIIGTLASGGMGTVYLARTTGSAGFSRFVAIKRLHPHYAAEAQLVAMLVDEARLAVQVRHANVIDTLDLVATEGAFGLVLEYIEGASLGSLMNEAKARGEEVPRPIAITILRGMLRGLDAAHEATSADGLPLGVVHRDVSPQNVLVGVDGIPRLIDFGIAKAMGRLAETTRTGEVRGKFAYMAPEQFMEQPATRQADIYAAGVMLWQLLTGKLPFGADDARVVMARAMTQAVPPPSTVRAGIGADLDAIVLQATARDLGERYARASELYDALSIEPAASDEEVGAWVRRVGSAQLERQHKLRLEAPTAPSRSVEELLAEATAAPEPAPADAPPVKPARRTWIVLPIAAAVAVVGVAGITRALHASPGAAVAEVAVAPAAPPASSASLAPPPSPSSSSTIMTAPEPTPAARRPSHRRPPKTAPSRATTPAVDPDTDHR